MANEVRSVLYLYGVSESLARSPIDRRGVEEKTIEALSCSGMICWISRVSAVDFERDLARNMENLDWLAASSIAHQASIAAIAAQVDILPVRFGTVFRNQTSLRRHVLARSRALKLDFKRLKGAEEWGVKVFTARASARPRAFASGREYLTAKAALLPHNDQDLSREIGKFEQALGRVALESAAPGTISRGLPGLRFQTTILVKRRDRGKLRSVLARFSRRWSEERKIEATGPWPPYSFVSRSGESRGLR
ncbi:MAG: GvpL/GvpF family gas vesicle protein [Acidobacteria bacterium]|nr:GvpL/GvpF family gas vesicle protein [Acidobacteriota bacterium]